MISVRTSQERGVTETGWLTSRHSFSFGNYYDSQKMQHGPLRVLNDDVVAGGRGFGEHPHRNAEIVSYVLSGELEHRDSLGNGRIIHADQFQYMSAGRGVTHSEFNPGNEPVHFLQIWLLPNESNAEPTYGQADAAALLEGNFARVAASDSAAPIRWRANAELWLGRPKAGEVIDLPISGERGYLHTISGSIYAGESHLAPGDAIAVEGERELPVKTVSDSEFLWFNLA